MYLGLKHLKMMNFKEKVVDDIRYRFVKNETDKSIFAVAVSALNFEKSEYFVPETVDGYPVYVIESFCFARREVERITLPMGIIKIYHHAFLGCENLRQINIPPLIEDIGDDTFSGCCLINNIDLSNIKSIGKNAFMDCNLLNNIVLSNVKTIEKDAFVNCCSLENLILNDYAIITFGAFKGTPAEIKYNI